MARSGGDALKLQEQRAAFLNGIKLLDEDACVSIGSYKGKPKKYGDLDMTWIKNVPSCPVFYPSLEDFKDPFTYICKIAPEASKYGICKIVSPIMPTVPAGRVLVKENPSFKFTTRVQPMRLSNWDAKDKMTFLMSAQRYTFNEFEKVANKFYVRKFSSSAVLPEAFVETEFWKEMCSDKSTSIEYASDVDGSAFSKCSSDPLASSKWNLKVFSRLSNSTLRLLENDIPGVTEPMLYIGMLFSTFAWHVEDHYLYSINYHHCGASKTWYGVPGDAAPAFEEVVKETVYDADLLSENGDGTAYDLLIGKTTMFPPNLLLKGGVPVYRAVQAPGEFVITFPRSYHAGFSHGFNCGEAVNFAMADWFSYGSAACRRYSLLKRMPLLPHEELLCKEARHLLNPDQSSHHALQKSIKFSYVTLMKFQHQVRWYLKRLGASISRLPDYSGNVTCSLCKHMCYVAFIMCRCNPEPICLNHASENRRCPCLSVRHIVLNSEIKEMEDLAHKLYDGTAMGQLRAELFVNDGMSLKMPVLEEDLFECEDYHSYIPFVDADTPSLDAFKDVEDRTVIGSPSQDTKRGGLCLQFRLKDGKVVRESNDLGMLENEKKLSMGTTSVKPHRSGLAIRSMPAKKPVAVISTLPSQVLKRRLVSESVSESGLDGTMKRRRIEQARLTNSEPNVTLHVPESNHATSCQSESGRGSKPNLLHTTDGKAVLPLRSIVQGLKVPGTLSEVMLRWKSRAHKQGFDLRVVHIELPSSGDPLAKRIKQMALTFEECQRLKQVLPSQLVVKLEAILQSTFGKCNAEFSKGTSKLSTEGSCAEVPNINFQRKKVSPDVACSVQVNKRVAGHAESGSTKAQGQQLKRFCRSPALEEGRNSKYNEEVQKGDNSAVQGSSEEMREVTSNQDSLQRRTKESSLLHTDACSSFNSGAGKVSRLKIKGPSLNMEVNFSNVGVITDKALKLTRKNEGVVRTVIEEKK